MFFNIGRNIVVDVPSAGFGEFDLGCAVMSPFSLSKRYN